jgi:hypothetical protein
VNLITVAEGGRRHSGGWEVKQRVPKITAPGVAAAAIVSHRQREKVKHDVGIGAIVAAANEAPGFEVI